MTGAMCGDSIPSSRSSIDDVSQPILKTCILEWSMTGVRVDDRAATVLAHMLLVDWEDHPFTAVELMPMAQTVAAEAAISDPNAWDIYPGIDRTIRFPHQINIFFSIIFC